MSGRRRGRLKVVAERPCKSNSNSELPNMADIMKVGSAQNVQVKVKSWGAVFEVRAISMVTGEEIGRANGFITLWFGRKGKILHLESIRMTRQAFTMHTTSIFGMGLLVGAVAMRHGFDCNCKTAELLAINDSPLYHSKLLGNRDTVTDHGYSPGALLIGDMVMGHSYPLGAILSGR
ncbi:hypothetical protein SUGI_0248620 [Cryptomeria japonica]|nr:hypothetical protein SUGI_0248620 [Cryptomeria japonica]